MMSSIRDAELLLDIARETKTAYAQEMKNLARLILLDIAESLLPSDTSSVAATVSAPPPAPLRLVRPEPTLEWDESPIEFVDEAIQPVAPASIMTSTTSARSRKNFAKFVRSLNLPNDTPFFYGSVKFLLSGAGTAAPSLTVVSNGMRITSPSPSGIISQYEKIVNKRTVTANGWDRLKMLDKDDKPRPLSWPGWDEPKI